MIRRSAAALALVLLGALALAAPAGALAPCGESPKVKCFGVESLSASLSTSQAGAHPDLTFSFGLARNPESTPDIKGTLDVFAPPRNIRTDLPPGLVGDPSVLGSSQQCRALELVAGECPNASQIGLAKVVIYDLNSFVTEPVYMMEPPGGDVIARVGLVGGTIGNVVYADITLRSEGDYGLTSEIVDVPTRVRLVSSDVTLWGVPMAKEHDTQRCLPIEALLKQCTESPSRPPGGRELPFLTNPTRCGVPLEMSVSASSWAEPDRYDTESTLFPDEISGCNELPYGPGLTIEPTSRRAGAPTGLDVTARIPASVGVKVLEPSQTRHVRVSLPEGMRINPGASNGLDVCSDDQVNFGERVAAECPDAAKLAGFEIEIPALPRRLKGAIYLREPEPGNLFRFWAVADDLGAHVKLQGQLNVDEQTGELESTVLDIPQAPVREMKILFKSGFRAPLVNPPSCGTYDSRYEFVPWSGGSPQISTSQMTIDEGCDTGRFDPEISAGSVDSTGGAHSPFTFTVTREDGEENLAALEVSLPRGMSATFAGVPRCEGAAAESGQCPAESRVGRVVAAVGAGPLPLWVPQPGKRPTAVYLAGPYKGAPLSVVAVVPAQAGPFDLGDQVVRSAIYVDPVTAQATAKSDPLPQFVEGVPALYRTANVLLDRPGFSLNPTSCQRKETTSVLHSVGGKTATPSSPFAATGCSRLGFKPKLAMRLFGGTNRGSHPRLRTTLKMPAGGANIGGFSIALPHSAFLDQAHIRTVCTRVQFAADQCPAGSIYGKVKVRTPLLEETLEGLFYLRSSNNPLPDMVAVVKGPASLPIEVHSAGRIDSVNGGIRVTFDFFPDAPITEALASFPGGSRGLIVNSTNLCAKVNRVTAKFIGQNGKKATLRPELKASCRRSKAKR